MSEATLERETPAAVSPKGEPVSDGSKNLLIHLVPGLLGAALYVLNNLNVLHAIFAAPAGYAPCGVQRHMDVGEYLAWLEAFKTNWVIPNYQAPWTTSRGLVMPGLMPIALLERLLSLPSVVALQLLSFVGYMFVAYAVAHASRSFFQSRRQALWGVLLAICCVPVVCLPGASHILKGVGDHEGWLKFLLVGDGFFHGLVTWPFVTLGTAFQLLSMSLLVRYVKAPARRGLLWLACCCFLSALMHPFEIAVTVTAVAIVFLREFGWKAQTVGRFALIAAAAGIGLSPHVLETLLVPWVHEISEANSIQLLPNLLLPIIGVPAMVALVLLLLGYPRRASTEITVLKVWCFSSFVVFYLPGMPFPIHFLDGIFFAIGFLLVIQAGELMEEKPAFTGPLLRIGALLLLLWSVGAHAMLRLDTWEGGILPQERAGHLSAIAPVEEFATVRWLRQHASPEDMVLATRETAPWLAAVPMHSFASHWLSSELATRPGFEAVRAAFFAGQLPSNQAHQLLENLGVRYVVIPDGSPAAGYMDRTQQQARLGSWTIYELPGVHMRPYHDPRIVALGGSAQ